MNVKSIAGGLGEGRARLALRPRSVRLPASHWGLSDFVALTKPRVMMLAISTALVGLGLAPSRPNSLALRASVISDSVHSSTRRLSFCDVSFGRRRTCDQPSSSRQACTVSHLFACWRVRALRCKRGRLQLTGVCIRVRSETPKRSRRRKQKQPSDGLMGIAISYLLILYNRKN
jgi:hypothetical protein